MSLEDTKDVELGVRETYVAVPEPLTTAWSGGDRFVVYSSENDDLQGRPGVIASQVGDDINVLLDDPGSGPSEVGPMPVYDPLTADQRRALRAATFGAAFSWAEVPPIPPSITGFINVDQTITLSLGSGYGPVRSASLRRGTSWEAPSPGILVDATATLTYVIQPDDLAFQLILFVLFTDGTELHAEVGPVNSVLIPPSISGNPVVGEVLHADFGGPENGNVLAAGWLDQDFTTWGDAVSTPDLTLTMDHVGLLMRVIVNYDGPAPELTSNIIGPVTAP